MKVQISDHALVRFIERVGGVDLQEFRNHIKTIVTPSIAAGASTLIVDGVEYRLDPQTRKVITIVTIDKQWRRK